MNYNFLFEPRPLLCLDSTFQSCLVSSALSPCAKFFSKFGFSGKIGVAVTTPIDALVQIAAASVWAVYHDIRTCKTLVDYAFVIVRVPLKIIATPIFATIFQIIEEIPARIASLWEMDSASLHYVYRKKWEWLRSSPKEEKLVENPDATIHFYDIFPEYQTKLKSFLEPYSEKWKNIFVISRRDQALVVFQKPEGAFQKWYQSEKKKLGDAFDVSECLVFIFGMGRKVTPETMTEAELQGAKIVVIQTNLEKRNFMNWDILPMAYENMAAATVGMPTPKH